MDNLSISFEPCKEVIYIKIYANTDDGNNFNATPVLIHTAIIPVPEDTWNMIFEIE